MQDQANTVDHDTISAELARAHAREAAMREILSAISRYRDDVQPVLACIARNAGQLCDAPDVGLHLVNEARTHTRLACVWGPDKGVFPVGTEFELSGTTAMARAIREARTTQIRDFSKDPRYLARETGPVKKVEEEGVLTFLCVPFIQNGIAIGCVTLNRYEVKPFTEDEIALLETFAAQAVIAIENSRQFREVRNRLEREQASREILQVISASRTDPKPVFDVILQNAARLCDTPHASLSLINEAGAHLDFVAERASDDDIFSHAEPQPLSDRESSFVQVIEQRAPVHIHDLKDTERYRMGSAERRRAVDADNIRTLLNVPLLRGAACIGVLCVYRREVRPYSDDEIALLETFAAQAVIAIENVRQFREVQTRLEREKATSHALDVISRSRDDEAPVFDVIIESASRLSNSYMGTLFIISDDGTHLEARAWRNTASQELVDFLLANPTPLTDHESSFFEAIQTRAPVHILDARDTERYRNTDGIRRRGVDKMNLRTMLQVPLFSDEGPLGLLSIYRDEVRAFTPDEIAMVETFAAQAVIAIENARQYRALANRTEEIEKLNASLERRVKDQVGEIERMGRLKRFLPAAVADTVVSTGSEKMLSSHRALLGVLFCDIRGFTAFCETAEPEETIEVLQTYHEEMGKLINAHGAGVDHRMGDGIMVLFNDPLPCDDPAGDAVRLALAMRAQMAELCKRWKRIGYRLGFGVGVSLGYGTVGMVGFEGRFDYTASGTAINLASRLCDEAEDGEILLSPKASIAVEDEFLVESRGELSLKGLREPLEVFRLLDAADI